MTFKDIGFVVVMIVVAIMFIERAWISNIALFAAAIYLTFSLERKQF